MKLIVNADDFGLSKAVNLGVVKAFTDGIVRSTTIMSNMTGFINAAALSNEYTGLGVGIHFVMTSGKAIDGAKKTLTDKNGDFFNQGEFFNRLKNNQIDFAEMETELRAQLKQVLSTGINPTHFDSHHHFHLQKGAFEVVKKLADENNLPIRIGKKEPFAKNYTGLRSTDYFSLDFYGLNLKADDLIALLEKYKGAESLELMVHPAYIDQTLVIMSSYTVARTQELDILTSPQIKDYIQQQNIELINFTACT
ncbi:MAG: chitin disaccharide deacetylase [Elusimicrobiota bacterium]|jgi:predicted glycoside hydrolase/deacetylase ChbG (UPF0249 family)|nr:chitin disaccharide deacetylase [Elusimicrobiota bacterium]